MMQHLLTRKVTGRTNSGKLMECENPHKCSSSNSKALSSNADCTKRLCNNCFDRWIVVSMVTGLPLLRDLVGNLYSKICNKAK